MPIEPFDLPLPWSKMMENEGGGAEQDNGCPPGNTDANQIQNTDNTDANQIQNTDNTDANQIQNQNADKTQITNAITDEAMEVEQTDHIVSNYETVITTTDQSVSTANADSFGHYSDTDMLEDGEIPIIERVFTEKEEQELLGDGEIVKHTDTPLPEAMQVDDNTDKEDDDEKFRRIRDRSDSETTLTSLKEDNEGSQIHSDHADSSSETDSVDNEDDPWWCNGNFQEVWDAVTSWTDDNDTERRERLLASLNIKTRRELNIEMHQLAARTYWMALESKKNNQMPAPKGPMEWSPVTYEDSFYCPHCTELLPPMDKTVAVLRAVEASGKGRPEFGAPEDVKTGVQEKTKDGKLACALVEMHVEGLCEHGLQTTKFYNPNAAGNTKRRKIPVRSDSRATSECSTSDMNQSADMNQMSQMELDTEFEVKEDPPNADDYDTEEFQTNSLAQEMHQFDYDGTPDEESDRELAAELVKKLADIRYTDDADEYSRMAKEMAEFFLKEIADRRISELVQSGYMTHLLKQLLIQRQETHGGPNPTNRQINEIWNIGFGRAMDEIYRLFTQAEKIKSYREFRELPFMQSVVKEKRRDTDSTPLRGLKAKPNSRRIQKLLDEREKKGEYRLQKKDRRKKKEADRLKAIADKEKAELEVMKQILEAEEKKKADEARAAKEKEIADTLKKRRDELAAQNEQEIARLEREMLQKAGIQIAAITDPATNQIPIQIPKEDSKQSSNSNSQMSSPIQARGATVLPTPGTAQPRLNVKAEAEYVIPESGRQIRKRRETMVRRRSLTPQKRYRERSTSKGRNVRTYRSLEEFRKDYSWNPVINRKELKEWNDTRRSAFYKKLPVDMTMEKRDTKSILADLSKDIADKAVFRYFQIGSQVSTVRYTANRMLETDDSRDWIETDGIQIGRSVWADSYISDADFMDKIRKKAGSYTYRDFKDYIKIVDSIGLRWTPVITVRIDTDTKEKYLVDAAEVDHVFHPDMVLRYGIPSDLYGVLGGPYFGKTADEFATDWQNVMKMAKKYCEGREADKLLWVVFYLNRNGNTLERVEEAIRLTSTNAELENYLRLGHYSKSDSAKAIQMTQITDTDKKDKDRGYEECGIHGRITRYHSKTLCLQLMHYQDRLDYFVDKHICDADQHDDMHTYNKKKVDLALCELHRCLNRHTGKCRNEYRCVYCGLNHTVAWCRKLAENLGLYTWRADEYVKKSGRAITTEGLSDLKK